MIIRPYYQLSENCQIAGLAEKYYSKFGEIKGTFVDVGAHDGKYCSNTWGLTQRGWKGVCFEAMPHLSQLCRKNYEVYPVTVMNVAVAHYDGDITLYTDGNPTINRETVDKSPWGFTYNPEKKIRTRCITLNTALQDLRVPHDFELLSIDVEGGEIEVLMGINFRIWKPKMVIIETGKGHHIQSFHIHSEQIESWMIREGYVETFYDEINSIYERSAE